MLLLVVTGSLALFAALQPEVQWRMKVVQLKLTGDLPDVEFFWLLKAIRPGSRIYLETLADSANPYAAIRNPLNAREDVEAGEVLFRKHCSACHQDDGHGAARPIRDGGFSNGDSDWAVFRIITGGIGGTAMLPHDLPEDSVWQIIAYLRNRADALAGLDTEAAADIPIPEPVTADRLRREVNASGDWLTYSGTLDGQRFSRLDQITRDNVERLRLAWVFPGSLHDHLLESTPLVVDGVLVTTEPPGTVLAINAETGRMLWRHARALPDDLRLCCGPANRGVAVGGSRVLLGTLDAHLVALDIQSGEVAWDVETAVHSDGYSNTAAPLVVNDTVIVGVAGGEFGIRGFIDAYDIATGERKWRFETIPRPGEPGSDSWPGDSWITGGGPTWMTGSYDSGSNLIFWGIGNPGPDFNSYNRQGDNLYTNSIVALDADSGAMRWYFQFTPEDVHDYDANSVPVIGELLIDGVATKVVMMATKNGFFYVLEAETGRFISAMEIGRQNWALGIDDNGRPIRDPAAVPQPKGTRVYPGTGGGANWWPPSFNPELRIFYLPVREGGAIFFPEESPFEPGQLYLGGSATIVPGEYRYHALRAVDPEKNVVIWEHRGESGTGGTLSTVTGLQFWGNANRLFALDGETGSILWQANVGGLIIAAPMTYSVNGRQYVAVSAGRGLFVFAL